MLKIFGENLRTLRLEKGLTQENLAKVCSTTKYTVSAWELGKQEPGIDMIVFIAGYFEITIDTLLRRD